MTEIDALKYELEENRKSFDTLHKKYVELLKQQGRLEKENEQLEEAREYYQENFLTMKTERNQFKRENELLKFQLDECRNNKLFSRRELEKENEQLQKSLSASVEKNRKLQRILDKLGYEYIGDLK